MAQLGTKKEPAIVRVKTVERAGEIAAICKEHGWKFIVGIEPDKREDISDIKQLLKSQKKKKDGKEIPKNVGRNEPCPCGSGLKFKKCCLDRK